MAKGGGQSIPTDTTTRTVSMPEFSDPYYRRMLQGAENAMLPFDPYTGQSTYVPYPGERIASSSMYGDIGASRAMTRGIAQQGIAGCQKLCRQVSEEWLLLVVALDIQINQ